MLPLLTAPQIRDADAYTIKHEPITSVDLMERASRAFVNCFTDNYTDKQKTIAIYCGTGNNGGDGLAIAQLLRAYGYKHLFVKIAQFSDKSTEDFENNLKLIKKTLISVSTLKTGETPEEKADIIIDALLGSGLNKPLEGAYKTLVELLNDLHKTIVSVDIPTGLPTEGDIDSNSTVIKADLVITF